MVNTLAWTHARWSFAGETDHCCWLSQANWGVQRRVGYIVHYKGFIKTENNAGLRYQKLFPKPKRVVIVMSDGRLKSEQVPWNKVLPRCADQATFLGALWLLWCHHGEALCDPACQFFHDRLGHLWEFLVEDVVGSLIDLNRSSETSGQTDGIHATQRLFIQSNNKYTERHKLQFMLLKLRQNHLPQRSQQRNMINENKQIPVVNWLSRH